MYVVESDGIFDSIEYVIPPRTKNKKIKSQGTLCTFVMNLYPSSFRRLFCAVFSSSWNKGFFVCVRGLYSKQKCLLPALGNDKTYTLIQNGGGATFQKQLVQNGFLQACLARRASCHHSYFFLCAALCCTSLHKGMHYHVPCCPPQLSSLHKPS